jgi:large conductance mechanosensitive channel
MDTMIKCLNALGFITIVAGVITGVIFGALAGSFLSAVICSVGGVIGSVIYFALAAILVNQNKILYQLQHGLPKTLKPAKKAQCEKCESMYNADMSSCPHCGFKHG